MSALTFYIVDVFAERRFAGNQLAVFRGAGNLSGQEMQSIAREMHFSETTFILSDRPANGGFHVRIFTPGEEVPFTGHPTLGTAHIIHSEIAAGATSQVLLNLKVGQIPVSFEPDGYCSMRQVAPTFGAQHKPRVLADVLGLEPSDIDDRFPIEEVSTGLHFFIVPLKSIAALKKSHIDRDRYYRLIEKTESKGILVFCPETHEPQNDLAVRVFVDYYGVPEDPATGSGNGCLAAYLAQHRYFGKDSIRVRAEQGYEIHRPSLLLLHAEANGEEIKVQVAGKCITVAQGELR